MKRARIIRHIDLASLRGDGASFQIETSDAGLEGSVFRSAADARAVAAAEGYEVDPHVFER